MTDQRTALETVKGMIEQGTCEDSANVAVIRMMGFRIIAGRMPREIRSELMQAVKAGRLGHLKKEGLKPEAFFHPNSIWNAKEERSKAVNASIRAIAAVCA